MDSLGIRYFKAKNKLEEKHLYGETSLEEIIALENLLKDVLNAAEGVGTRHWPGMDLLGAQFYTVRELEKAVTKILGDEE